MLECHSLASMYIIFSLIFFNNLTFIFLRKLGELFNSFFKTLIWFSVINSDPTSNMEFSSANVLFFNLFFTIYLYIIIIFTIQLQFVKFLILLSLMFLDFVCLNLHSNLVIPCRFFIPFIAHLETTREVYHKFG